MRLDVMAERLIAGVGELVGERTPETWGIRIAAWRLLSRGEPVSPQAVADEADRDVAEVLGCLKGSSDTTREGLIDAAMGLSLRPTQHRMRIGSRDLYTWCALDLLLIPPALGLAARVESVSPESGATIRAVVTPDGVDETEPAEAVVSVVPVRGDQREIRGAFCNFVHFFSSPEDARSWQGEHPEGWVLAAHDAFELGSHLIGGISGDCCA